MNINLTCPINSLSYGLASLNILKALSKNNEVSWFPIGNINQIQQELQANFLPDDIEPVSKAFKNAPKYDRDAPSVRIWHQHDLAQHVGKGTHIGFPIFELEAFNEVELHQLESQDALIVCSEWAKRVVESNIKHYYEVFVAPLGVDRNIFKPNPHPLSTASFSSVEMSEHYRPKSKEGKPFVFLNVGKWEIRKGHDVLCEIFNSAFSPKDDVELWLCPHNFFLKLNETQEWEKMYMDSPMGRAGKIKILPRVASQLEMAAIMRDADCGVCISRAEGFDLPALEMLSTGLQLVATNNTAHTEFLTEDNAYLTDTPNKEPAYDGKWFFGDYEWASLDESVCESIVQNMRRAFSIGKARNMAGILTAKKFSWDNTATCVENAILVSEVSEDRLD